ncbi:MAG: hypothetical protein ABR529_01440 [Actinomycetota bacterium]
MSRSPGRPRRDPAEVVPLKSDLAQEVARPTLSRPGRLHGLATMGMTACALLGTLATLAFITVGWPGQTGRTVIAVVIGSAIGFMACASAAVFSAARDTYPHRQRDGDGEGPNP